jgi:integrase
MLSTAKNWGYSAREVELKKLVLPDRNSYVAPHFTPSQIESIFSLAQEPWRTFFVVLAMTGMRAGEALGLQWADIDFDHSCIHIRRSAWYGNVQSTKNKTSSVPIKDVPKLFVDVPKVRMLKSQQGNARVSTKTGSQNPASSP